VFLTPVVLGATDRSEPIVVQDPQYGEVLFYFYQEDYFPALVRLLAERLTHHADEAELLLGGMYLSYGHHLEAAEIFERLLADNVDADIRDRTWFFLAKIWYQRGYLEKAQEALSYIQGDLPEHIQREALMLDAQILLDAGEYDVAIAKLQNWNGRTEWASYAKFNIGVALVRSGRVDAAAKLLNDLGDMDPFNEELTSLRDKANLALGYGFVSRAHSRTRPYLVLAGLMPKWTTTIVRSCPGWSCEAATCSTRRYRNQCWRFLMRWRNWIQSARRQIIT
jgi:tetratricopeptide (TPR) repeat protein